MPVLNPSSSPASGDGACSSAAPAWEGPSDRNGAGTCNSKSVDAEGTNGLADRLLPPPLFLADLAAVGAAFAGALHIRHGMWTMPGAPSLMLPLLLMLVTYAAVLAAAGLYRTSPRNMHLPQFLRAGTALLAAWAASVTLMYLAHRMPSPSVAALHGLLAMAGILGLRVVLRHGSRQQGGTGRPAAIQEGPLQIEDLLPRAAPAVIDTDALRDYLTSRTVLVTGAGGSIGSQLAEQLLQLRPSRLVLVDVSEYNLFQLENELRARPFDGELEFCLADVRDRSTLEKLFADFRPEIVLHAAAYKHVPLMERHPAEAFRNNTQTTVTLLQLSEQYEAEQFVFVSTDKAVEPQSVLGATKRLSEWYVRSGEHVPGGPRCKTVRFGNVFGSQGSVVPLFEEQLRSGGPLRVTHPAMERYFMSTREASSLTLQTLLLDDAPTYIFDMGEPVSIQWLAEAVIRRLRPGADPADHIVYTGIRPGEKLREQLHTADEQYRPTPHDHIRGVTAPVPYCRSLLESHFRQLEALCTARQDVALRRALLADDLSERSDALAPEHRLPRAEAAPLA